MARAYALLALLMMSQSSIYKKPRPQWMDMHAIAMPVRATSECKTERKSGQIWLINYTGSK